MALMAGSLLLALVGVAFVGLVMPSLNGVLLMLAVLVVVIVLDLALAPGKRQLPLQRAAISAALGGSPTDPSITSAMPASVRLGQQCTTTVQIHNRSSRRARVQVRDLWVPSAGCTPHHQRATVTAGSWRWISFTLHPTRRGQRESTGMAVRSIGPLHVAARQWRVTLGQQMRVLPAFSSRKHLPSRLAMLHEIDGSVAVLRKGQGTEFDSLRDYVIGDDVRAIDWSASARLRHVLVRTFRPERDRRVLIVVDTSRTCAARIGTLSPMPGEQPVTDATRLDAMIEAALLLTALAGHAGDRVDLLAYDITTRAQVRGVRPPQLLPTVVNALCHLQPHLVEADMRGLVSTVMTQARRRSLVVLLTSVEPASIRDGLLPVLGHLTTRHTVVVASVEDPRLAQMASATLPATATSSARRGRVAVEQVYQRASASISAQAFQEVHEQLARHHAEVVTALPDDLAPALADRYLSLKAAGRL